MKNIFELTERPDKKLFYSRNDQEDIRLGDSVKFDTRSYDFSEIVILGSPQDEGVKRNKGREGAKDAPDEIRKAFYKLSVNDKINSKKIFDLGDIKVDKPLEEIHEDQEEVVYQIINDGKKLIILGGGNDISYPDCKALAKFNKSILALNIDSHFDVRFNETRNSGTPYRMLLEENILINSNFFEIGYKKYSSSPDHIKYLTEKGVKFFSYDELKEKELSKILSEIIHRNKSENIFWGFDMDSVSSVYAPGVSAPSPLGLNGEEAVILAEVAGKEKRTKIFEISEVNPKYDLDGRTSRLAAIMIWYFLQF